MKNTLCAVALLVGGVTFNASAFSTSSETAQSKNDKSVWISIGSDAVNLINQKHATAFNLHQPAKEKINDNGVTVVSIEESQLDALSKFMHQNFKRCGGYFYHDSLEEAMAYAKSTPIAKSNVAFNYTIDNEDTVNTLLGQLTPSNMTATVTSLGNYNNRYFSQASGFEAASWIKSHWESIAGGRSDIKVELYQHTWVQPSVIVTIQGTENSDEIVVIGGHLDSINNITGPTGRAPGFDDNASGIAVITETLNTIVATDYKPSRTLLLMGYAAEEVGLRGSKEIAQEYQTNGKNVVGVAQFDMTGYHGTADKNIVFMSDFTNNAQNQFMAQLIDKYLPNVTYGFDPCGYACSDHASWHNAGFAASFPFESNSSDYNSTIHTSNDSSFDVDHATNFLKLSVAYVGELAKGSTGNTQQVGSIQLTTSNLEIEEGQTASVTINRVAGSSNAVTIDYATQDGSAVAGTDYVAATGTLNWADQDSSSKTIDISTSEVTEDKTFNLVLTNPQGGAALGTPSNLTITIKNKSTVVTPPTETPQTSSGGGGTFGFYWVAIFSLIAIFRRRKQY
ncbi:M20/M25/M40 family metallo-hydrolase [Aliikangiella coralliicola]|uniref:M20/M25/M40 family metallo-hydrolase n=1 Tax=Aliikangiella coralliicola TaxID=2592383 RepID=A0A545UJ49_9GAMM|nr:M20/M25/M40 family metallo-hydrolase [Aliikangiella coralliicola]TQV89491.1 M20/M25/M40 family metallo-hydrolase [Aliikangiella coralliicola]